MALWVLFDSGKKPIPVLLDDDTLPTPEDLICRWRGNQSLVDERLLHAYQGYPVEHNYQWLGPYTIPTNLDWVPQLISDDPDDRWDLSRGPFCQYAGKLMFHFPGYGEVLLEEILTASQCHGALEESQIGYLTNAYLS